MSPSLGLLLRLCLYCKFLKGFVLQLQAFLTGGLPLVVIGVNEIAIDALCVANMLPTH